MKDKEKDGGREEKERRGIEAFRRDRLCVLGERGKRVKEQEQEEKREQEPLFI